MSRRDVFDSIERSLAHRGPGGVVAFTPASVLQRVRHSQSTAQQILQGRRKGHSMRFCVLDYQIMQLVIEQDVDVIGGHRLES